MIYHIYINDKYYKEIDAKNPINIGDIINFQGAKYTVRKVVHDIVNDDILQYLAANIYCY